MNGEKPTLRIGHHMLEGKVVTLPKPLAVLRKRTSPSHQRLPPSGTSDSADEPAPHKAAAEEEEDEIALDAQAGGGTSYEVVEVVRKKVVFARRPALVIDKPAAAGGGKK
ncbi:hypothetical protein CALCODRAFT_495946 [Calocera cornea HHB12733]|uniref:Uncharacterized protein n=1 Tax=Calocera cornea HHB12733 TaxID=1353952 RepID=A0A165G7J7_9BASI|nr:hypothetical protein CALCODRAFT_495946 [Calocera cornea HHB12733]